MKSLNIIFPEKNEIITEKEEITEDLNATEILCEADKSLISIGTELFCLSGEFGKDTIWESWVKYPFHPGYSMVARVIGTGKKVSRYKKGDRIFVLIPHKQYFKVKEDDPIFIIPEEISSEEVAWSSIALTTQLGVRAADTKLGDNTGVIGLGMLGQLIVQYLKNLGVSKIIAIDRYEERLKISEKYGATHIIKAGFGNDIEMIKEITKNKMLDVLFEVTGNPDVLSFSSLFLKKFGKIILIGDTPTPSKQYLGPNIVSNSIKIIGVHANNIVDNQWNYNEMIELFFNFLEQGRMNVKDLITDIYNPIDAPKIYKDLQINRSNKIGILFDWCLLK